MKLRVRGYAEPNPARKWWQFWKPRFVYADFIGAYEMTALKDDEA